MWISFCPKIAHQKNSWWHHYEIPFNTSPYTLKEKNMMDLFTQNADKKIIVVGSTLQVIQREPHLRKNRSTVL